MTDIVICIAMVFSLIAAPLSGSDAGPKEDYELQERCGKRAEELFKRDYGNGVSNTKDGQAITGYRNHYSTKLNKCFVLLTTTDMPYKDKQKALSILMVLYDINENREYGSFFKRDGDNLPFDCKVAGRVCRSQQEWEALVSPYMDE